jgi:ribonuclease P protein component
LKNFSLSKTERIKRKKDFEKVFSSGATVFTKDRLLKAVFIFESNKTESGIKIAPAVSKKAGKAVWRNRVKRIIREAYRQNKEIFVNFVQQKELRLLIVFSPNELSEIKNKSVELNDILPGVVELMNKIVKRI